MRNILLLVISFAALMGSAFAINVNACGTLSAPGTYTLTKNINTSASTNCLNVTAADVTIDCKGFRITGANKPFYSGIYSTKDRTKVQNCTVAGFLIGINFQNVKGGAVEDSQINVSYGSTGAVGAQNVGGDYAAMKRTTISAKGQYTAGATGFAIENSKITSDGYACQSPGRLVNSSAIGGLAGVTLGATNNSYIANSVITGGQQGLYMSGTRNALVENNVITSGYPVQSTGVAALVASFLNGGNVIRNNTLKASTGRPDLVYVTGGTGSATVFYWNNFTDTAGKYLITNTAVALNYPVNGQQEGNVYANVMNKAVNITGTVHSAGYPSLYIGSGGAGYPYSYTTSQGKLVRQFTGNLADYAPLTPSNGSAQPPVPMGSLIVNATPASGGVVNGTAYNFTVPSVRSITSAAKANYIFASWSISGNCTIANASAANTTVTVNGGTCFATANFLAVLAKLVVTATPGDAGNVTGNTYVYVLPSTLPISATPAANYAFTNWSISGNCTIASTLLPSTTVTVTGPGTCTALAHFVKIGSLIVSVSPPGAGSASGTVYNITVPFTGPVLASNIVGGDYTFANWSVSGNCTVANATSGSTTVTVNSGTCYATANFALIPRGSLIVNATPANGGVVTGTAYNFTVPATLPITASANANYAFTNWSITGNCTIANASAAATTATVNSGTCYATAHFNYTPPAPQACVCGISLTTPNYVCNVTQDLNTSTHCFDVQANNVTILCNGHTITGAANATIDTIGVTASAFVNDTSVKGCNMVQLDQGVNSGGARLKVENSNINATQFGILILGETDALIRNNSIYGTMIGINAMDSSGTIANNTIRSDNAGLELYSNIGPNGPYNIYNNTFASPTGASDHVWVIGGITGTVFYWNNFTATSGAYVSIDSGTQPGISLNTTINGKGEGNIYANVLSGAVHVQGNQSSSGFPALYIGVNGTGYPYSMNTAQGKINVTFGNWTVADYAPLTQFYYNYTAPPQGCVCGVLNVPNYVCNVTSDLNSTGTCFTVSAANVTIECNGHSITGSNAASSYGAYTSQPKTKIRNCNISNFDYGIRLAGANGTAENITAVNNNWGIGIFYGSYNTVSGCTASARPSGIAIDIFSGDYNTVSGCTGTANSSTAIRVEYGNYNTILNSSGASSSSYGMYFYQSSYNTVMNSSGTSNLLAGINLGVQSSHNAISNCTAASSSNFGLSVDGGSNYNSIANSSASSDSGAAISIHDGDYNSVSGSRFASNTGNCMVLTSASPAQGSASNGVYNNTMIAPAGALASIDAASGNNTFYWNNFTSTSGYYIQDLNGSNFFNATINGKGEGNIYANVISGAVQVQGSVFSQYGSGLYIGMNGTGYPYGAGNSLGKVVGAAVDYAPLTPFQVPPQGCQCGILNVPNYVCNVTQDLGANGTCFAVTAYNVTILCNGHTLTGSAYSNYPISFGVSSTADLTTVRDCTILHFTNGVYFSGSNMSGIYGTAAYSDYFNPIELVSSSYDTIMDTSANASVATAAVNFQGSSNGNVLQNVTAYSNGQAAFSIVGGIGNVINGSTALSTSTAIVLSGASNNTIANSTISTNYTDAVVVLSGSGNVFAGNTIYRTGNLASGSEISFQSGAMYNLAYWNNFTATAAHYISDVGAGNSYNTSINGRQEGNIYANVMNGSVAVQGNQTSSGFPALYIGINGTGFPYSASNSQGKVLGSAVDYAPLTPNYLNNTQAPQGCQCGILNVSNYVCNVTQDLSTNGTCFYVQANNVTIECNGHSITGIGSGTTSGITAYYVSGFNARNCRLNELYYGIWFYHVNSSSVQNGTINSSQSYSEGIFMQSSQYNSISAVKITNPFYGLDMELSDYNNISSLSSVTTQDEDSISAEPIGLHESNHNRLVGVNGTSKNDYSAIEIANSNDNVLEGCVGYVNDSTRANMAGVSGIRFEGSSNNILSNAKGISTFYNGIGILSHSNNNSLVNCSAIGSSGIDVSYSNNNVFDKCIINGDRNVGTLGTYVYDENFIFASNFTTIKSSTIAGNLSLWLFGANNNIVANNTISASDGPALKVGSDSLMNMDTAGNLIVNNTLASNYSLVSIEWAATSNTFYWNNFTGTNNFYIVDNEVVSSNFYNTTINGKPEGNIYGNIMNGSVQVQGNVSSSGFPSLYIGSNGTGYPYDFTTSQGKIVGSAIDYAPLTPNYLNGTVPQGCVCGNLTTPNYVCNVTHDLTTAGDCFDVLAQNVTIQCNGHSITGSGAGQGIFSTANRTFVNGCNISGFTTQGIHYQASSNGAITNTNVSNPSNYAVGLGYYSSNNTVSNCRLYSFGIALDIAFNSNGNTISNVYANGSFPFSTIYISQSNGNTITNSTIASRDFGESLYMLQASNNTVSNSVLTTYGPTTVEFANGATGNRLIGNRITSYNVTSGILYVTLLNSNSSGNVLYWNNFTASPGAYVRDYSAGANYLNTTMNGRGEGNIYDNVMTGAVAVQGNVSSGYGSGLYIGMNGTGYPYGAANSGGKVLGNITDYAPLTSNYYVAGGKVPQPDLNGTEEIQKEIPKPIPAVVPKPKPIPVPKPAIAPGAEIVPPVADTDPKVTPKPIPAITPKPSPKPIPAINPKPSPTPSPAITPKPVPAPAINPKPAPTPAVTPKPTPSPAIVPATDPKPAIAPKIAPVAVVEQKQAPAPVKQEAPEIKKAVGAGADSG